MVNDRCPTTGKAAFVTGGSRGIGRAIVIALANSGYAVGFTYRTSDALATTTVDEVRALGGQAWCYRADVRDAVAVRSAADEFQARFPFVEVVVNNAGHLNSAPLHEMTIPQWDEMIATHLNGTFYCTHCFLPGMIASRRGKVINITGSFGVQGAPTFVHLSAAKAGVIGFTRALAREVGQFSVQVNAVAPAMIATELTEAIPAETLQKLVSTYPLQRIGRLDDVVATVMFLISEAGDFYTGQTLCPSGGSVMV